MNKICTSIEQSKKLIELGIDVNTADMFFAMNGTLPVVSKYIDDGFVTAVDGAIPCWSLSTLMNLLPSEFTTENKFGKYKYEIKIRKYKLTDGVNIYQIAYGNYKWYEDGSHSWKDMINTGQKEELLDAVFDMVCWLLEDKKI